MSPVMARDHQPRRRSELLHRHFSRTVVAFLLRSRPCRDTPSGISHRVKCFSEFRKPVELALGKAHVEAYVLAINEPMLRERVA